MFATTGKIERPFKGSVLAEVFAVLLIIVAKIENLMYSLKLKGNFSSYLNKADNSNYRRIVVHILAELKDHIKWASGM